MARRRADAQPAWKALQVTRVSAARPEVRHHCEYVPLTREQFHARFMERFYDPAFDDVRDELEQVFERAWSGYSESRKSPRKRRAGAGFADPGYELAVEWLAARNAIARAQARHDDPGSPSRILIVNGSTRSEHTCPGEISKTLRLALHAREVVEAQDGVEADLLNVSDLADQPWKVIHPCKACVSTSMALCHWPCSCYPNHALGQTNDWMAEIYPRWVAAHGVIILCPVNWYHAPGSTAWSVPMAATRIPRPRTARTPRWPRPSSWRAGPIRVISRVGRSPSSRTATPPDRRSSAAR
jgi:hypothetical protein